jgi:hypothetical protein
VKPPGSPGPAPKLISAELPPRQWAAVVTTRGWIKVPVQFVAPFTRTVLGQPQAVAGSPPMTGSALTATKEADGASAHAQSASSGASRDSEPRSRRCARVFDLKILRPISTSGASHARAARA